MSELQGILDCLSQEASLDSSGRFTLDFQRAAEPLGVFLRDHPAWPWLRAIQLAHQQLADSIQITISRDQVKLRYQAQRWAQDWGCVGRWLQGAEIRPPRTAVADVVLGMSASGALEWKVLLGQQPVLSWKNQAALWVADQTEENFVVEIQARFQAPGWFGFRKNPLSGIHADILQRCGLSPVTILIDGFTVNDPHWRGLPGISATTSADGDYQVAGESLHWPSANLPRQQRMATNPPPSYSAPPARSCLSMRPFWLPAPT